MGLLSALGRAGVQQLRSGAMFGEERVGGGLLAKARAVALPEGRTPLSALAHQDPINATYPWEQRVTPTDEMVLAALERGATRGPASDREVAKWGAREHAERIATLMRDGWSDPIKLRNVEGRMAVDDGYHRLAAARLRGDADIATIGGLR